MTKWEADKYTPNFSFVYQYGNDVIELLELKKNMAVLDLGCGNGALTKRLSDMGVRAVGLGASADQLDVARRQYPNKNIFFGLMPSLEYVRRNNPE